MLKNISAALLLVMLAAGASFYYLANREVKGEVDRMLAQAVESGAYQDVSYEAVQVALNGEVRLSNLRVVDNAQQEVVIEEVLVRDYDIANELPHFVSLQARGFRFPQGFPTPADGSASPLQDFFAELAAEGSIPLTLDYRYDYQPDADQQLDSRLAFTLDGSLSGEFASTVRKVPLDELFATGDTDPAQAQMRMLALLSTAQIPAASFRVSDQGLLDRLLARQASQSGMSVEDFRALLVSRAQNLYLFAPAPLAPFATEVGAELAEFLAGGKTLNLSLAPEHGGSVQQLQTELMTAFFSQNYARIVEVLNVELRSD